MRKIILLSLSLGLGMVLSFPAFAESMDSMANDAKAMDASDAKEKAKDMKMDEKKHGDAIKKARVKYDAAVKKAQLDYVKNLKRIGRAKAQAELAKAKKTALNAYNADKKQAMKDASK